LSVLEIVLAAAGRRADVHKMAFQFLSEKESGALRPQDGDTRAR